jgi:hypothetical protein
VVLATAFWLRRVDEVEIADQLWASFVGLNGFFITAICWEILAAANAAPPVHRSALYVGTAAVTAVTYFWRRFRRS